MVVTIFNAKKTTTKFPSSPYDNNTFYFETKKVDSILDVFDYMVGNFVLDIPLQKSFKAPRQKDSLPFVERINYIIIDIDDINKRSDRELAIEWFKTSGYRVVLGESRTDFRLKGVLRCEGMTPKEARLVLIQLQQHLPGVVDRGSVGLGNYQAPILKHRVLYDGGHKIYPKVKIQNTAVGVRVPDLIQQLCIDAFVQKGYTFFERTDNGYRCKHPSEIKTPGGFSWNKDYPFTMSHWNSSRNDSVWHEIIKTPEYKKYQKQKSLDKIKAIAPNGPLTVNARYLSNHPKEVSEFLDYTDMLKIQSPMGTAKSKIIEEVLFQARKRNLRVLFVTNRISLADDIANKYDNIKHYLGTEIEENVYTPGDDLVVQIDSLHKYTTKFFDVVILDEAATTLMYLLHLEHHQKKIATQVFSLANRKLVLADAFLFEDMIQIFEPKSITKINNGYRDKAELEVFQQKDAFLVDLIKTATKEPITFSSGSTIIIKIVQLLLDNLGIEYVTITSETTKSQKESIYKAFKRKKPVAQVMIYSPSLTVGVSNLNEVYTHYHFDSGMSMDVLSSLQMTKRTRTTKKIKMYLNERIQYHPTELSLIQNNLTDFIEQDKDGDDQGISKAGVKYSKLQQIHNTLENRHRQAFIVLLKLQFKGKTTINKTRISGVVHRLSKIVKQKEMNAKLEIFEAYKKMSSTEIQEIEMDLFGVTKEHLFVKEFNNIKNDETLTFLDSLEPLIKEEIKNTGIIQALKELIANPKIYQLSRNGKYSKSVVTKNNIDKKKYKLQKKRSVYTINPVIHDAYKVYLSKTML